MATDTPDALATGLHRFGLERDRMRTALARRTRVSETDLDALEHLEADGPLTQRDLGERLSLTSGAVTMLVDRLERAGWAHRRPHPTDRRYISLELSKQAREHAPSEVAAYHARIRQIVESVPAADREIIREFLGAAASAASDAADELRQ